MKKCKTCLEMYGHDHPTAGLGEFKMFGDYCPYCGSFNSDFNKDSFIALVIAAIFFVVDLWLIHIPIFFLSEKVNKFVNPLKLPFSFRMYPTVHRY